MNAIVYVDPQYPSKESFVDRLRFLSLARGIASHRDIKIPIRSKMQVARVVHRGKIRLQEDSLFAFRVRSIRVQHIPFEFGKDVRENPAHMLRSKNIKPAVPWIIRMKSKSQQPSLAIVRRGPVEQVQKNLRLSIREVRDGHHAPVPLDNIQRIGLVRGAHHTHRLREFNARERVHEAITVKRLRRGQVDALPCGNETRAQRDQKKTDSDDPVSRHGSKEVSNVCTVRKRIN